MEFLQLRDIVTRKILYLRSIERLLSSPKFYEALEKASDEDKCMLEKFIEMNDKISILNWIRKMIDDKSLNDLKKEAKILGMTNYTKKNKFVLEGEIREWRRRNISV